MCTGWNGQPGGERDEQDGDQGQLRAEGERDGAA
jgi:hypothetical protein